MKDMMTRKSNIELLRILCMFFVVIMHFNNHGCNKSIIYFLGDLNLQNGIGHLIESITMVAVNCYVLISGYFGMSFKVKSLLKLYLQCFFIGLLGYLLYVAFTPDTIQLTKLIARLFAFSRNRYWFLFAYLFLYFSAPLLNLAISKMTRKDYLKVLGLMSVFLFYFSYIREVGDNTIGMSYVQFIYLYLIGRFIKLHMAFDTIIKCRYKWLFGYLVSTACVFGLALLEQRYHLHLPFLRPYPYNSPFIVAGACFLLLFVLTINVNSRAINWIASSVFAVYLLQDNPYFGFQFLYPKVEMIFQQIDNIGMKYLVLFAGSGIFLVATVIIDKIFVFVAKPIILLYEKYLEDKVDSIIKIS